MNIKVGDIIECKKTREGVGLPINKKGNFYKVLYIENDKIIIDTENEYKNSMFSLFGDPRKFYLFKEYFITKNEIRKQKLKKIKIYQ